MSKVSSSLCRGLRHLSVQSHNPNSANAVVVSTRSEKLQNLADHFKENSNFRYFRRQRLAYKATVHRLAKHGRFSSVHDILNFQKRYPDIKDEHFTARLICLYGEAKMLDHALHLFDEMRNLNCPQTVISFNALLAACFPSKSFSKVVELFQELPGKLSIKPNVISYTYVIKAICEMGLLDDAILILKHMEANDVKPDIVMFGTLLGAFYSGGRFCDAEKLWKSMEEKKIIPDLICYNSKLLGTLNEKRLTEAIELFNSLEVKGLKPETYTYNLMIKGLFVNGSNWDEVKKVYTSMLERGCTPDFVTCTTLITYACDSNDIDFAYEICKDHAGMKNKVSKKILKRVTDNLVEQSKIDKANELVQLDHSKSNIVAR